MTKAKAEIKIKITNWITGSVIWESEKETVKEAVVDANLRDANLRGADLRGADLHGANLRGMTLDKLPTDYVNQCSRDILFILEHLKSEVPFLREKLIAGEIDGSQYEGDCACLVGTLANADKADVDKVCEAIPFYEKGIHNYGEMWFLRINKGDTPENNEFAKHAVKLCDMVLAKQQG